MGAIREAVRQTTPNIFRVPNTSLQSLTNVALLGVPSVTRFDASSVRFRDRKSLALFAFLVTHPGRRHSREGLVDRFWPDSPPRDGRNSLNTALSSIRKALPAGGLETDGEAVWFDDRRLVLDIRLFERHVGRCRRREGGDDGRADCFAAIALYRGDFLDGHGDEWVLVERERWREAFRDCLRAAAGFLDADGDVGGARATAQRWVDFDPLDADAHALLIRLLLEAGRTEEARGQWRQVCRIWEREALGELPETLRRLADRVLRDASQRVAIPRLPRPRERLVGRERELSTLSRSLTPAGAPHLTTLTGPAGVGKSRLASEVGVRVEADWDRRVLYANLTGTDDSRPIGDVLLDALGHPVRPRRPAWNALHDLLGEAPCLVIIDDAHHHPRPALAAALHSLLEHLPSVRLLVTSRHRIGIEGERETVVSPLGCAPGGDACRLFVDRVGAQLPEFDPRPEEVERIADLCARLDGIPLALEIAAARYATDGSTAAEATDASQGDPLHRAVAESVATLSPGLQRFLFCLGIFDGGWTIAAAEAVGAEMCAPFSAYELLTLLLQSSLITRTWRDGGHRFTMREAVRSYSRTRLSPEAWREGRQRHAAWCVELAEQASAELPGKNATFWLRRLDIEDHHFEMALGWAEENGDDALSVRLCNALAPYWSQRLRHMPARRRFDALCARPPLREVSPGHAAAWSWRGHFCAETHSGDEADAAYSQSLSQYRALGDRRGMATVLWRMAERRYASRDFARTCLEESVALFESIGDSVGSSRSLLSLGGIHLETGRLEDAETIYRDALRRLPDPPPARGCALILSLLGDCLRESGCFDEALAVYRECEAHFARIEDSWGVTSARNDLARLALARGDLVEAERLSRDACALAEGAGQPQHLAFYLQTRGVVAHSRGDFGAAGRHLEKARALHHGFGAAVGFGIASTYLGLLRLDEGRSDAARAVFFDALPALVAAGECKRQLMCLTGIARLWVDEGRIDEARALVRALDTLLPPFRQLLVRVHQEPYGAAAARVRSTTRPQPWNGTLEGAVAFAQQADPGASEPR